MGRKIIDYSGERYAFTRSTDPFAGLDDYRSAPTLEIRYPNISFPIQEKAFDVGYSSSGINRTVGYFFETVSRARRGGETQKPRSVNNGDSSSRPDVIIDNGRINIEVKGINETDRIPLYDDQMARYSMVRLLSDVSSEIDVEIFRHCVEDIGKQYRKGGLEWLASAFPRNIKSLIYFPFPLVFNMWDPNLTLLTRGYDIRRHSKYTSLPASLLNVFLAEPERALRFVGENSDNWTVQKYRFSEKATSNRVPFTSFPVAFFIYKKRKEWNRHFRRLFAGKDLPYFEEEMDDQRFEGDTNFNFGANINGQSVDINFDEEYPDLPF
jgi:hypothetical protein